jgi:hypothetical protein
METKYLLKNEITIKKMKKKTKKENIHTYKHWQWGDER